MNGMEETEILKLKAQLDYEDPNGLTALILAAQACAKLYMVVSHLASVQGGNQQHTEALIQAKAPIEHTTKVTSVPTMLPIFRTHDVMVRRAVLH